MPADAIGISKGNHAASDKRVGIRWEDFVVTVLLIQQEQRSGRLSMTFAPCPFLVGLDEPGPVATNATQQALRGQVKEL